MSRAPLISVVIPCHNQGHFLRDAVASVGAPAMATEVVVVDDGSTDDSGDVAEACAREAGPALTVRVVHQTNAGVSAARNRGFAESRGALVVFLDADDRLAPDALEVGARAIEEHPGAAFVYGRCRMMDADGTLLPTPLQPRIVRHHYHELLRSNFIWTPANVMFRREPLERSGAFRPGVSASADYELYLRLARTHPIFDHGQVVAHYRRHTANMSGRAAVMLRETLMVLRSQWPYVSGDPEAEAAYHEGWRRWQQFYGDQLANEVRAHARAGEWLAVVRKAAVLGVLHPRGLLTHAQRKLGLTMRGMFRPAPQ
jgi:glycosyltransferase involved in cell wall biosynthesis